MEFVARTAPSDVLLSRRNGSKEDTDLERISLQDPRIKHLRDLFVIESRAQSRSRTLLVLTACEYRAQSAIDFPPGLALGGMFLAVVGGEAPNRTACCNLTTGYKAFSATATLFTLRVRSSGDVQAWAEGGVGWNI